MNPFLHVTQARHLGAHRVWLEFSDGVTGEVDLAADLTGPVFEPLRSEAEFARLRIEGHTLAWPNGADFAPEFLREKLPCAVAEAPTRYGVPPKKSP